MAFILNRRAPGAREAQAPAQFQSALQFLAEADAARDDRRWQDAARLYKQYLAARPGDAPIWVQLGHAFKESGDLQEAERAYKQSLELAPDIADTHMQLGHLYKRTHNFSGAITA